MAEHPQDEAFARYVVQTGMATSEQLEQVLQNLNGLTVAEALVRCGAITSAQRDAVDKRIQAQQQGGIQLLGNYRLLKKLGEGSMGSVYLAEDTVAQRSVAIKVLPKKFAADAEFLGRFRREAKAMGKLNHENIVAAYNVGEEMGHHFYVMEYYEGESLDVTLKREKFISWDRAIDITSQIARGLRYAHEHNILHRDIKPANIFITKEGTAKILDLGLSKNIADAESSFQTQSGRALGTPHYISPEQARGDKGIDGRADIYSLGASLYHLVTGQTPFQGPTSAVVLMKHVSEQIPNPQDIREETPDAVVMMIQKMMAKSPEDRYLSCKELLADLERVSVGKMPADALDATRSSVAMRRGKGAPRRNVNAVESNQRPKVESAGDAAGRSTARHPATSGRKLLYAGAAMLIIGIGIAVMATGKKTPVNSPFGQKEQARVVTPVAPDKPASKPPPPPSLDDKTLQAQAAQVERFLKQKDFATTRTHLLTLEKMLRDNPGAVAAWKSKIDGWSNKNRQGSATLLEDLLKEAEAKAKDGDLSSAHVILGPQRLMDLLAEDAEKASKVAARYVVPISSTSSGLPITLKPEIPGSALRPGLLCTFYKKKVLSEDNVLLRRNDTIIDFNWNDGVPAPEIGADQFNIRWRGTLKVAKPGHYIVSTMADDGIRVSIGGKQIINDWTVATVRRNNVELELSEGYYPLIVDYFENEGPASCKLLWSLKGGFNEVAIPADVLMHELDQEPAAVALAPVALLPDEPKPKDPAKVEAPDPAADADWNKAIDLLAGLDVQKAKLKGTWTLKNGALLSDRNAYTQLQFPYDPPLEYDYRIVFKRVEGSSSANMILSSQDRAFLFLLDGWSDGSFGFDLIDGKFANDNPTGIKLAPFENGRVYTSVVQVRKDRLIAFLDGKKITEWTREKGELSLFAEWKPRNEKLLGLGTFDSQYLFQSVQVLEITGKGKLIKESVAMVPEKKPDAPLPIPPGPVTDAFVKAVATLPAEEQVKVVINKLKELNKKFGGAHTSKVIEGKVTELTFSSYYITDLSPLRALLALEFLSIPGDAVNDEKSVLIDISPLRGLPLIELEIHYTNVADLTPLKGMPLQKLRLDRSNVRSLAPLAGMPLTQLGIYYCQVVDISPLRGMKLTTLEANYSYLRDIAPLANMPLEKLLIEKCRVTDHTPLVTLKSLKTLSMDYKASRDAQIIPALKSVEKINTLTPAELLRSGGK